MTENNRNRHICTGLMAHVDSGKTTLSEALLYASGTIRKLGKVDTKDAFLDTDARERDRGITIFSKQAELTWQGMELTLLDTPGHVDFSAEMERVLQVLDYAVLLISGADGVQGHTQTLWSLLQQYEIPTFLFINKMDQPGANKEALMAELKSRLSEGCIDFSHAQYMENGKSAHDKIEQGEYVGRSDSLIPDTEDMEFWYEELATCQEEALETYLETGSIPKKQIRDMITDRLVFPCYFGSALKEEGVDKFLKGVETYTAERKYGDKFAARVFKIARDAQGNRLTYLKVTGGVLKVKMLLKGENRNAEETEIWEEKVDQIRIYSGARYEMVKEAKAGMVCAVTGLNHTFAGEGLGLEEESTIPLLEPVLSYKIELPPECDAHQMLRKLRQLEEEEPQLHIVWEEQSSEIHAKLMGDVQIEILQSLIRERFGVDVSFGEGSIVYKETIAGPVEGIGHFEPLRHYAEVHLLLEPLERGSGVQFDTDCSEDLLDRNWQRLILTHLEEKEHIGVLTGSAITDIKITLIAGRAHQKHTEGGDFRQATYRAVRQGLKRARSILLEPCYEFCLEIPMENVGRAMTDLQNMGADFEQPMIENKMAGIKGRAPVSTMRGYQKEVISYTRGFGNLVCSFGGYIECHNAEEVIAAYDYDSEHDLMNPTGSVFCAHGAGFVVPWDQVPDYMHLEERRIADTQSVDGEQASDDKKRSESGQADGSWISSAEYKKRQADYWRGEKELEEIFARTYGEVKRRLPSEQEYRRVHVTASEPVYRPAKPKKAEKEYLLVDGYNIIFAWEELKELSKINIDSARDRLKDILCNYQGYRKCTLILVFDAYRVKGHREEITKYHNIHVVYTKEAETADMFIEKTVHAIGRKYQVTVATSDGLEQVIIMGQGGKRLSAAGLKEEVDMAAAQMKEHLEAAKQKTKTYLGEYFPEDSGKAE